MRPVTSLIDGHPVAASSDPRPIMNPANLSEQVSAVSLGDADTFVAAARSAAAAQPGWAAVPAPARGQVIQHLGRLVEDNLETLAALITREIGKPIGESPP